MAQSVANWCNMHSRGSHAFTHTFTTTLCEAPAQLLQNLESNFYFEGTWGRGSKPEYPEKNPDILPTNRHHILEEKIQRPRRDSNPHPPTLAKCVCCVWPTELQTATTLHYAKCLKPKKRAWSKASCPYSLTSNQLYKSVLIQWDCSSSDMTNTWETAHSYKIWKIYIHVYDIGWATSLDRSPITHQT